MTLTPCSEISGSMRLPRAWTWRPLMPNILGMEGPVMSASRMPTLLPRRASSVAMAPVTNDLPTPPLPESTAITRLTSDSVFSSNCDGVDCPPAACACSQPMYDSFVYVGAGAPRCDTSVIVPSFASGSHLRCIWAERACNTMGPSEWAGLLNFAGELEVLHALQLVDRRGVWAVFRFQVVAQPVGTNIAGDIDGGHI